MYIIFSSLSVPASAHTETFTLSKVTGSYRLPSPSPSQWEREFSEGCGWIHEQACPGPSWLSQEGWPVLTKPLLSPLPSSLAFWNYPVVLSGGSTLLTPSKILPMTEKVIILTGIRFGWINRKSKPQAYTK